MGRYTLIECDQADESQRSTSDATAANVAIHDDPHTCANSHKEEEFASLHEFGPKEAGTISNESSEDHKGGIENELLENPPPSEWLEDTLIDLYLSNYPNQSTHAISDSMAHVENNGLDGLNVSTAENDDIYELEDGEWIPDDHLVCSSNENVLDYLDEGPSLDEENWQAQYGQVIRPEEDSFLSNVHVINLWDWSLVKGRRKKKEKKHKVTMLVGRLIKRSAQLHPSMPSSSGLLRTAPICEVHLDLVRVKSGTIYRLQNPSSQYLASLSTYDSSNPTKGWRFPQLLLDRLVKEDTASSLGDDFKVPRVIVGQKDICLPSEQISAFNKGRGHVYRDRAAERRALHNGIGVGPGQKKSFDSDPHPSTTSASPEEAMAESLNRSFGTGSYARKILENMGWKEGDALGSRNDGLIEPLQANGNIGNAGLGWNHSRGRYTS
ncbi:unnamed protein product [Cuscuta campestris]|uniref:G-patch domain-containing protein n=1 Tax=Cuscuta campestris TaxID=132261 RepID=A0A484L257_9ASTE|nr:unnamed protein product [Cuscuta campestris]